MKKLLFICSMIVASLTASAQFTVYQPVEVPRTTYTPSPGYGTPFTIYEPVYGNPYQQRQQQAKPTVLPLVSCTIMVLGYSPSAIMPDERRHVVSSNNKFFIFQFSFCDT